MDDMTNDKGRRVLQDRLMQLMADEAEIVRALELQISRTPQHPEASKTLTAIHNAIKGHCESLRSELEVSPGSVSAAHSPIGGLFDFASPGSGRTQPLSNSLRADFAAFNYAALGYAALFEMSLRLYVPALREIAPQLLEDYAKAAQAGEPHHRPRRGLGAAAGRSDLQLHLSDVHLGGLRLRVGVH